MVFKRKTGVDNIPAFILSQCLIQIPIIQSLIEGIKEKSPRFYIKFNAFTTNVKYYFSGNKSCKVRSCQCSLTFKRKINHVQPGHAIERGTGFKRTKYI